MYFGEYIKELRIARGLNQREAAKMLGISPPRLNDIERGRRNYSREPPTKFLRKISAVYDHPISKLMEHTEMFQYEKSIVLDLLSDVEPALTRLDEKVAFMCREAAQYTPEMEASTHEARQLLDDLKTGVRVARVRLQRGMRVTLEDIRAKDTVGE